MQTEKHKVILDVADNLPKINIDKDRMTQIIYNIINNAIKYSPDGGDIIVKAYEDKSAIRIDIIDFGVGILGKDVKYYDTAKAELKGIRLERKWKHYTIDLGNQDLTRIKTPFVWTLGSKGWPITFYLDDIMFE